MRLKLKLQFSKFKNWQKYIVIVAGLSVLIGVLSCNLFSVPPPSSPQEQAIFQEASSKTAVKDEITFGPQKVLDLAVLKVSHERVEYFRIVSVLFAVASAISFFILIKLWISRRVALLATIVFATSTWVLHSSHWVGYEASLLLVLPLLLLAGTMLKIKEYDVFLPITSFITALLLYIPGVWIFILIGLLIVRRDLLEAWNEASLKARILWAGGFFLPLIPLIYGLFQNNVWQKWLGLSSYSGLSNLAENIISLPGQFIVSGLPDPWRWLPGTPIFDIVTIMLSIVGLAYIAIDKRFPIRRAVLIGFALLSLALIALFGTSYISLVLPLAYIFAAFGIAFLLEQWLHIFPINPMARTIGIVIVSVLILFTASYHVARFYYVWPRAHETKQVFER